MSALLSAASLGLLALLLLIVVSALFVFGLCRAAKLGDDNPEAPVTTRTDTEEPTL